MVSCKLWGHRSWLICCARKFDVSKLGTEMYWSCPKCNGGVGKLLIEIQGVKDKRCSLETHLNEMSKEKEKKDLALRISLDDMKKLIESKFES